MNRVLLFSTALLFCLSLVSCNNKARENVNIRRPGKKEMADLNSYFVEKDRERILAYIERRQLEMTESPTGLWYVIKKQGNGEFFGDASKVLFDYDCTLLDGTKCYSSRSLGPKEVIIGKTPIEAGLDEGLRKLKPGAEAIFILPPFLAHGLIGDSNAIPPRATIVYEIRILTSK
ncbi:MAG: FKBP-type peptidyl-prolyl cis-trans isomerase [Bacteroidales bacterium]